MPLILVDRQDAIGTVTFNNHERRNSLSHALLSELSDALGEFKHQKTRVVIIRAEPGARVWSAGLDVRELPDPGRDPLSYNDPLEQVLRQIRDLPAPVIAMIEGGAWGGACDLSFTCDIAIGCPTAAFTMTPAKLGIPYNSAGVLHFVNIVGLRIASEMFFTAQCIEAERALQVGILNYLVPTAELESFTYQMARTITENSPLSIAAMKEQLHIIGDSYPITPETFERVQGLRRRVYDSADYQEGKRAFLEKRKPLFKGE